MWEYSEKVKELFFNPKNAGVLEGADGIGDVGAISCGDALRLMIKVDPETDIITDARFQTFGCGSAIASSSALTELIIGKTIDEAMKLTNQDIADSLGGLPPEKMHCSVMGYEALRAAVANYRGEAWVDDHEEGALICKCFGIDEGMVERAIRMNQLNSVEAVTHYTKAAGSCGTCTDGVENVLMRVNKEMVTEGLMQADQAFDPVASIIPVRANKKQPAKPSGKISMLQRIRLIEQSIEELRPYFKRDGGDCELVDVEDDCVFVKFSGACLGCQMEGMTLQGVQERIFEKLGSPMKVIPVHARH
ncbi:MAG: Nitrogen fixation protein nifU [Pseudomonadota bacterium]|jgi:NifU-like protein